MGYSVLIFIVTAINVLVTSEVSAQSKAYNAFERYPLGSNLDKFDSLVCAEHSMSSEYYKIDTTKQCQVFRVSNSTIDRVQIGDIRFGEIILIIDTLTHKVKGVSLMKMYLDNENSPLINFLNDFKTIIGFLKSYFGYKPKNETTKNDHNTYYSQDVYTWTKKKVKYILKSAQLTERGRNQTLSYLISLDYYKLK